MLEFIYIIGTIVCGVGAVLLASIVNENWSLYKMSKFMGNVTPDIAALWLWVFCIVCTILTLACGYLFGEFLNLIFNENFYNERFI